MQSSYIRYERVGQKVRAVRVTKQWVTREVPNRDSRKEPTVHSKFMTVRVSVVPQRAIEPGIGFDADGNEPAVPAWTSGGADRVESRERMMTLLERGQPEGEPLVREAGYDQRWLPLGDLSQLTAAQARQDLDTQLGGE